MQPEPFDIGPAGPNEFDVASEFWVAMRRDLDMPDEDLAPDWKTPVCGLRKPT